jgi:hypothetical protein
MVVLTVLNLYGKLLSCLGLRQYAFDNDYQEEKIEEGKAIVEAYKNHRILLLGTTSNHHTLSHLSNSRVTSSSNQGSHKKILPDVEEK